MNPGKFSLSIVESNDQARSALAADLLHHCLGLYRGIVFTCKHTVHGRICASLDNACRAKALLHLLRQRIGSAAIFEGSNLYREEFPLLLDVLRRSDDVRRTFVTPGPIS